MGFPHSIQRLFFFLKFALLKNKAQSVTLLRFDFITANLFCAINQHESEKYTKQENHFTYKTFLTSFVLLKFCMCAVFENYFLLH